MEFTGVMWYWLLGIAVGFLPLELYAAKATPGKADTFSEFVWWVFGVKPRSCGPVKYALFRRLVLVGMCVSLTFHFVFAASVIPVVIFGVLCGIIMVYAFIWERPC
jgi:hypothetical protein